ncbi:hypothetical protein PSCLAVI8L_130167 [Pseudoclavibacter sp. 8L]|nr:hypothetical protein PSCLAVI8L_130167 [Pseudoclavibacter sp. 8L]
MSATKQATLMSIMMVYFLMRAARSSYSLSPMEVTFVVCDRTVASAPLGDLLSLLLAPRLERTVSREQHDPKNRPRHGRKPRHRLRHRRTLRQPWSPRRGDLALGGGRP